MRRKYNIKLLSEGTFSSVVRLLFCIVFLCMCMFGCTKDKSGKIYDMNETDSTVDISEQSEETKDNVDSLESKENSTETLSETDGAEAAAKDVYVHVCGAVNSPGVYRVSGSLRVFQVIEMAGGAVSDADLNSVNMARPVYDEMKVYVPRQGEVISDDYEYGSDEYNDADGTNNTGDKTLVNINKADVSELMTLPGIGQARAEAIVSYRGANGEFKCTEDIMNISGIKQAAYDKIKDLIEV